MKKILVLTMVVILTQFAGCKQSKNTADKGVNTVGVQAVEAQAKTEKKQTLSIKEKMESSKTFYEFGCRTEKDIYTFLEISESNWKTVLDSNNIPIENLDSILNTPVNEYFFNIGFAIKLAYGMKEYIPDDYYKACFNILKTWFNSEDPDTWIFPYSGLF